MDAETAAHSLLEAHRTDTPSGPLSVKTAEDAYLIQDIAVTARGGIGGWKVGQHLDGEISCAPVPSAVIHASGASLSAGSLREAGLEVEFAFTLAKDLPPREKLYALSDVLDAIEGLTPLIEVVATRFADSTQRTALENLSDGLRNFAFVTGRTFTDWRGIDLTRGDIQLVINGETHQSIKPNPARDPLKLLIWLANHAAQRCGGLRAGEVITTGSLDGATLAGPGAWAEARFGDLGTVAVSLTA